MRIPHHHQITLGYCRELGVPIEVFVNENEAAYVYQTRSKTLGGRRLRQREVRADMGGYAAELLSKAIALHALDEPLTGADRDALLEYLRRAGALDDKATYKGSARRGYSDRARRRRSRPARRLRRCRSTSCSNRRPASTCSRSSSRRRRCSRSSAAPTGSPPPSRRGSATASSTAPRSARSASGRTGSRSATLRGGKSHELTASYAVSRAAAARARLSCAWRTSSPRSRRPSPRCRTRRQARSACSSRGASGKRTNRSSAASPRRIRRSRRSSIRRPPISARKGVLIGYYQNGANAAAMAKRTARGAPGGRARTGRAHSPAVSEALRACVLGVVAERALVARRLGAVLRRRAQDGLPAVSEAGRPGVFRRRSRQLSERLDGRRARVRTTSGGSDSFTVDS